LADIFNEVDEAVRRERLEKIWQRYGTWIIAAAVLIVAGVGGWRGYDYLQRQKAQEAGAQFEASIRKRPTHSPKSRRRARAATQRSLACARRPS
jgi:hypothetical protein